MPRIEDTAPTMSDARLTDINRKALATDHSERNVLLTIALVAVAETFALAWLYY
jgi:hypothetical protein